MNPKIIIVTKESAFQLEACSRGIAGEICGEEVLAGHVEDTLIAGAGLNDILSKGSSQGSQRKLGTFN